MPTSRRTRASDASAAVANHLPDLTSPATLMGPPKGLSTPWKLTLLPIVAMSISALLYTLADPFIDRQLPIVSTEPHLWHQIAPLVSKVAVLWHTWALKLDATNAFAVTVQTRTPFYFLLYLFYNVSLQTTITSILIDATSSSLAFILLGRSRPVNYNKKAAAQSVEAHALYDVYNRFLLTLLGAAIYALSLYTLCVTKLPELIVTNFYPVASLERAYNANLVTLAALCIPLGWASREFLFGPATAVDASAGTSKAIWVPFSLSKQTVTVALRSRTLYGLTYFETFLRTYTSLGSSTFFGAGLWAALWAAIVWLVSVVLAYVGAAAHGEGEPKVLELEDRDVAVVPKRSHRRKASKDVL